MNLKLACADFAFPLLPHDRALDLISMLEFDGVDIGLFEGRSHLRPSQVFKSPVRSGAQLRRKLMDRGLHCADVFLQMDTSFVTYAVNHPEAARRRRARDWFLRTLDYSAACGARHVTTLPGVYFEIEKPFASWQRCCDELAWRVETAKRHHIVFSVEAHVGSIVPKPAAAMRLVRSVPGLTLTLDYTHFTRAGLPDREAEPLVAYASHFHARGARKGRLQTSLKQNTINYGRVIQAMKKANYRGYLGVEYVWVDWEHCNEVDNLSGRFNSGTFSARRWPLIELIMFCLGLAMKLRPGAYENYKLAHDQLWPELAEGMRANQVSMAIYRDGDRLFVFAAAPSEQHWLRSRQDPVLARWDARMTEFLESDQQGHLVFDLLSKTFGFGEFK